MKIKKSRRAIFFTPFLLLVFVLGNMSPAQIKFLPEAFAYLYYEEADTLRISSSGASDFWLETPRNIGGEIRIQTWEKNELLVKYEKKSKANTKREAREFIELIELDLDKTEDVIILEVSSPRHAPWEGSDKSARLSLHIFIPEDFNLRTETIYFDYDISGPLNNVEIENGYGKIYVEGVAGETDIQTSYGGVEARDLSGRVNIETSYGSIFLSNVDTQDKTAFLKTAYDKIDMRKIRGDIKARTNYSPINGTDLELSGGTSSFETIYSKVDLKIKEIKDCDLFIENTHGNVHLGLPRDVSAGVSLSIDPGGRIETAGLSILVESIDQTSLKGVLGEGESNIEVDVGGIGKILLESYE